MQRTGRGGQEPFSEPASTGCRAAWKKVPDPFGGRAQMTETLQRDPSLAGTDGPAEIPDCVELGVWTTIPVPPSKSLQRKLKCFDRKEFRAIKDRGVMTFHAVGCTGCHADQEATRAVAAAMAVQVGHPHRFGGNPDAVRASFLYHLGDVVYRRDKDTAGEQSVPPQLHQDFSQL